MTRAQAPASGAWTVDECPDAQGHWTIRVADGSANGDTDAEPIATVYAEASAARIVACVNACQGIADPAHELEVLRSQAYNAARQRDDLVEERRIMMLQAESASAELGRLRALLAAKDAALHECIEALAMVRCMTLDEGRDLSRDCYGTEHQQIMAAEDCATAALKDGAA